MIDLPNLEIAPFDPERDRGAARRIFAEVGWTDLSNPKRVEALDARLASGRAWVARIDGEAECLVHCVPGELQHLDSSLALSGVSAVATSRTARRLGIAGRLTARAIAEEAEAGAQVSALGVFEQGFYDKLGYGTGSYDHWVNFDPQKLLVPPASRVPARLGHDDWREIHACRLARPREHGWMSFHPPELTRGEMTLTPDSFGLGFRDETGTLTHHVWIRPEDVQHGPYGVTWLAYRTPAEFMELLGVLKNLGDQIRLFRLFEPAGIQLQDFVSHPLQGMQTTAASRMETGIRTMAFWQVRMCDVAGCLEKAHLEGKPLRFNLRLLDPVERYLEDDMKWRGVRGDYIVTLGWTSNATPGIESGLPTLSGTVNAFTRLWLGVRPATGLAVTDTLDGPTELLEALDKAFRLPTPKRDWVF